MAACTAPAASSNAATATIIHCTRLHDSSFPFSRHGAGARIRGHVVTTRQPNPSFLLLPSPEDCGSRLQTAGGKTRNRRGPGESLLVKEGRSNARVAARRKTCGENKGKGDGSNAKAAPTGWAFRQPDAYRRGSRVRCAARGGRQPKRLSHPDGRLRPLRAHAAFPNDFSRCRLPSPSTGEGKGKGELPHTPFTFSRPTCCQGPRGRRQAQRRRTRRLHLAAQLVAKDRVADAKRNADARAVYI